MTDAPHNWSVFALATGIFNLFAGLSFENWLALIGTLGMIISLVLQFLQWKRRRNQETELFDKRMGKD